jgi:hypothetical protein
MVKVTPVQWHWARRRLGSEGSGEVEDARGKCGSEGDGFQTWTSRPLIEGSQVERLGSVTGEVKQWERIWKVSSLWVVKMEVATRHSGLPVSGSGLRSRSPMWQPQVVQKKRSDAACGEWMYPVRAESSEDGGTNSGSTCLGRGAWKLQRVP